MRRSLPAYVYKKKGYKGREYLYFIRRPGAKPIRMHHQPGTPEFAAEYARAMTGAPEIPQTPRSRTFKALIASYRRSDRFTRLAPRTRKDYDKVLTFIHDRFGDLPAIRMKRKDVIRARDSNRDAVRFANYVVQIFRVLFEHAIDEGWREDNPARGVKELKGKGIERRPWPKDKIEAFRVAAPVGTRPRLIFELLLGTGQRIGDVLRMRWDDIEDGGIKVRQGKTKLRLWVPLTRDLRAALDAAPRRGLTIVGDKNGQPIAYDTAAHEMRAMRKQIGAEAYDQHALRYTAAAELAALGCDDETIQAITGHTTRAMLVKYAGEARQRARARAAAEARDGRAGQARNGTGTEREF